MNYVKIEPCSTRLGNWMFQFAAAKTAAVKEPVSFVIEKENEWAAVQKYACLWGGSQYCTAAPIGCEVRKGLFQDAKFVDRTLSRELYKCPAEIETQIQAKYGEILRDEQLVSIHVRRGDYLRLPHRHPFVGEKYLAEAVSRFPDSKFLVFSDDIAWCKRFFAARRFPGVSFIFAEGNSVLMDLFAMTKCRGGHICSNSTFSWWGAFLGVGKTIFPSMWYGPAAATKDWSGLYFGGCEVVKNWYAFGCWLKARMYIAKNYCGRIVRKVVRYEVRSGYRIV